MLSGTKFTEISTWNFSMLRNKHIYSQIAYTCIVKGSKQFYLHIHAFIHELNVPTRVIASMTTEAGPHLQMLDGWKADLAYSSANFCFPPNYFFIFTSFMIFSVIFKW